MDRTVFSAFTKMLSPGVLTRCKSEADNDFLDPRRPLQRAADASGRPVAEPRRRWRRSRSGTPAHHATRVATLAAVFAACQAPQTASNDDPLRGINVLAEVQSWAAQLQGLETETAIHRVVTASVDMVVIDPVRSIRDMTGFPTADLVRRIHNSAGETLPSKRCLAYLNVGQAEDYRGYWNDWRAPNGAGPGRPDFVLGRDPDGWEGDYRVAFWDQRWQHLLFGSPDSLLDQILADGFDGVYLDWILGFQDPLVVAAAERAGVDPAVEMVSLLREIRRYARARSSLFVVVGQNSVSLAEQVPEVLALLDGIAQEDLSFRGEATARWNESRAGDIAAPPEGDWSTAQLGNRLGRVAESGIPVFTIDYALQPEGVRRAVATSRAWGFVPFVSRTPLDRLPEHVLPLGATPR